MASNPGAEKPKFDIKKIYLRDLSFESPESPHIFTQKEFAPQIDVQIRIGHTALGDSGHFEVVLIITATAKHKDKTIFLVEVQQAGIFEITGVPEDRLEAVLEVACPNVLLPFAREAVADLANKGGFPQLLITPVNFEALYASKRNRATTESESKAGGGNGASATEATA
jgi:preprotein translocase subunit SecB